MKSGKTLGLIRRQLRISDCESTNEYSHHVVLYCSLQMNHNIGLVKQIVNVYCFSHL